MNKKKNYVPVFETFNYSEYKKSAGTGNLLESVSHLMEAEDSENKYSDISTSDITFGKNVISQEIAEIKSYTGSAEVSMDNHPVVNLGYLLRHIYSVFNKEFSIGNFERKYLPIFVDDAYNRRLDILGLYTKNSGSIDSEKSAAMKDGIDSINGILKKIGNNISLRAFNSYIKADDTINFVLGTSRSDYIGAPVDLGRNLLKTIYRMHRYSKNKDYHFRGYPYSLVGIMFAKDGDVDEFMKSFLKINISGSTDILNSLNKFDTGASVFSLNSAIDSVEDEISDLYFDKLSNRFSNYWDGKTEDAIYGYVVALQTLFYIKGYLDYTYKKFVDPGHKRNSFEYSSGVEKSKVEQEAEEIKPPAPIVNKVEKYRGKFAGDTGSGELREGMPASQEVANMQVTVAGLISKFVKPAALDRISNNNEIRIKNALDHVKKIDSEKLEPGKKVDLDTKLNDGIYGFRTKKLVQILQSYIKKFSKLPEKEKNAVEINGVYDEATRKAVEMLIRMNVSQVQIAQSQIAEPSLSSLAGREAERGEAEEILNIINSDSNLTDSYNAKSAEHRKELLAVISTAVKGLDDDAASTVIKNILGNSGGSGSSEGSGSIASAGSAAIGAGQ